MNSVSLYFLVLFSGSEHSLFRQRSHLNPSMKTTMRRKLGRCQSPVSHMTLTYPQIKVWWEMLMDFKSDRTSLTCRFFYPNMERTLWSFRPGRTPPQNLRMLDFGQFLTFCLVENTWAQSVVRWNQFSDCGWFEDLHQEFSAHNLAQTSFDVKDYIDRCWGFYSHYGYYEEILKVLIQ